MQRPGHQLTRYTVVIAAGILLSACQTGAGPSIPLATTPAGSHAPSGTPGAAPSREPYAQATVVIPVAAGPRGVVLAGGSLWVASTIGSVISQVDPASGDVIREIDAGPRPVTMVALAGGVWANVLNGQLANDDELVRLDPLSGDVVVRVTVPAYHNIAAGGGRLWSVDDQNTLYAVDPATASITASIPDGGKTIAITANDSAVWGIRADRHIWRVPAGGGERAEAPLGVKVPGRSRVAVGAGKVYVGVPGSVLALDPETLAETARLDLPGLELVNDLFLTSTDVWLSAHVVDAALGLDGGSVLRLDPATLEITASYRLGPESSGVVAADGNLWAVDQTDNVLVEWSLGG